ncbi:hypothetical protein ANI02nite_22730 [Acetobacter nitrogenifigens DSM 23921 = NBRC 105050]|uniref:Uncharacterized protein n=1 Tax=Acetobacter nitrogenifigens DSM 23921 = NBRC 105050 TaxID=1120919 RepID=A0A511XBP2_9PROT|nr:hypothetical protein ANI02nite_22730 [Acetobacter nitrogenifigens DSM 23921 = NBRC 105050]
MSPFPRHTAKAAHETPIDHEAAADACSKNDAEHISMAASDAKTRLCQREAICVVGDQNLSLRTFLQKRR